MLRRHIGGAGVQLHSLSASALNDAEYQPQFPSVLHVGKGPRRLVGPTAGLDVSEDT